jgi:hypothetical protein
MEFGYLHWEATIVIKGTVIERKQGLCYGGIIITKLLLKKSLIPLLPTEDLDGQVIVLSQ